LVRTRTPATLEVRDRGIMNVVAWPVGVPVGELGRRADEGAHQ
jgi:hypothetical protein